MRSQRAAPLLLLPLALAACGGTDEPTTAEARSALCDGSDALRFAGVDAGGAGDGVPRVAMELGWRLLLVDGQCSYWAMTETTGPVRSGVLSAAQAAEFSADLELGRWTELAPSGCPDASTTELRFLEDRVTYSCISTAFTETYRQWLSSLYEAGSDVSGDVRFSITDASEDSWVASQADLAQEWPLALDPDEVAVAPLDESDAEPRTVTGADAAALRALRAAYLPESNGAGPWLRIPVKVDAAGVRYYNLAMRDTLPFERDGRLALDEFFE